MLNFNLFSAIAVVVVAVVVYFESIFRLTCGQMVLVSYTVIIFLSAYTRLAEFKDVFNIVFGLDDLVYWSGWLLRWSCCVLVLNRPRRSIQADRRYSTSWSRRLPWNVCGSNLPSGRNGSNSKSFHFTGQLVEQNNSLTVMSPCWVHLFLISSLYSVLRSGGSNWIISFTILAAKKRSRRFRIPIPVQEWADVDCSYKDELASITLSPFLCESSFLLVYLMQMYFYNYKSPFFFSVWRLRCCLEIAEHEVSR